MELCGKSMPKAKNGADRGICILPKKHHYKHKSRTCYTCGTSLTYMTTKPSNAEKGSGLCRNCWAAQRRATHGMKPRNYQILGLQHTFPCGCTGVLPNERNQSNEFVCRASGSGRFSCRISSILRNSQASARRNGSKPISKNTPHSVIRKMMSNPNCVLCGEHLQWAASLGVRTPHLHHDHDTGIPIGFTHSVCNPQALRREIEQLLFENSRLRRNSY